MDSGRERSDGLTISFSFIIIIIVVVSVVLYHSAKRVVHFFVLDMFI